MRFLALNAKIPRPIWYNVIVQNVFVYRRISLTSLVYKLDTKLLKQKKLPNTGRLFCFDSISNINIRHHDLVNHYLNICVTDDHGHARLL